MFLKICFTLAAFQLSGKNHYRIGANLGAHFSKQLNENHRAGRFICDRSSKNVMNPFVFEVMSRILQKKVVTETMS